MSSTVPGPRAIPRRKRAWKASVTEDGPFCVSVAKNAAKPSKARSSSPVAAAIACSVDSNILFLRNCEKGIETSPKGWKPSKTSSASWHPNRGQSRNLPRE